MCDFTKHRNNHLAMYYLNVPHQNESIIACWGTSGKQKTEGTSCFLCLDSYGSLHLFASSLSVTKRTRVHLYITEELFPVVPSPPEIPYIKKKKKKHLSKCFPPSLGPWPSTIHATCSQNQQTGWADKKREIKWEERNCRGYVFGLQKQSGENFLAFAPRLWTYVQRGRDPEEGVITGGDQAWSNPPPPGTHTDTQARTYLVLF